MSYFIILVCKCRDENNQPVTPSSPRFHSKMFHHKKKKSNKNHPHSSSHPFSSSLTQLDSPLFLSVSFSQGKIICIHEFLFSSSVFHFLIFFLFKVFFFLNFFFSFNFCFVYICKQLNGTSVAQYSSLKLLEEHTFKVNGRSFFFVCELFFVFNFVYIQK